MDIKKLKINKKYKKPKFLIIFISISVLVLAFLILFVFNNIRFLGVKSVNEDAKKYQTRSCLVFYPKNENGKEIAKNICKDAPKNSIYDYALVPYGDFYLVEYGNEYSYYINKETTEPLKIESISENSKVIISDYLRYEMKKDEIDEAYTLDFIEKTRPRNLYFDANESKIKGKYFTIYFSEFDYEVKIPLKYMQKELGINLGYNDENYVKPVYVSPRRKIVAFTFDDGPKVGVSDRIVDYMHEYDAACTFFVQGMYLDASTISIIKESIRLGNQYGSHTQDHPNLINLTTNQIYDEIIGPANDFINGYHVGSDYDFDGLAYQMAIYRPPYGSHNALVDSVAPFIGIAWDCDSLDWSYRDKELITGEVLNYESVNTLDGKIVLFHDYYKETAEAMEILVPKLIDKGYQFVVVDDILEKNGISHDDSAYPW